MKSVEDLPVGIYKNITTTEICVLVDIDAFNEMNSAEIHT